MNRATVFLIRLSVILGLICFWSALAHAEPVSIAGRHVSAGCDPNGWCWTDCTVPSGWRELRVRDPGAVMPRQWGEYAVSLTDTKLIILPTQQLTRMTRHGWSMSMVEQHELAHACGQTHKDIRSAT